MTIWVQRRKKYLLNKHSQQQQKWHIQSNTHAEIVFRSLQTFTLYYRLHINRSQKHLAIGEIERFSDLWRQFFSFLFIWIQYFHSQIDFIAFLSNFFFVGSSIEWNGETRRREKNRWKCRNARMKFIIFNKLFIELHQKAFEVNGGEYKSKYILPPLQIMLVHQIIYSFTLLIQFFCIYFFLFHFVMVKYDLFFFNKSIYTHVDHPKRDENFVNWIVPLNNFWA